jgi:hypothetical protein
MEQGVVDGYGFHHGGEGEENERKDTQGTANQFTSTDKEERGLSKQLTAFDINSGVAFSLRSARFP